MQSKVTITANFRESLMLEGQQAEGVHFKGGIGFIADSSKIDTSYWTHIGQPCRTRDWQITYIRKGECHNQLNLLYNVAHTGELQIVPPGVLVVPLENEPTLNLGVVSISNELLVHTYKQKLPINIPLDSVQQDLVEVYLALINKLMLKPLATEQTIASVVDSLMDFSLSLAPTAEDDESKLTKHQQLFRRFHLLLNEHGVREHKIAFYADRLAITPNYLNTIIKEVSGQTITEWVNQLLVSEAKAALTYSNMSIEEITDALHFTNAPFFCKFFKNHTGMRPSEYRKANKQGHNIRN